MLMSMYLHKQIKEIYQFLLHYTVTMFDKYRLSCSYGHMVGIESSRKYSLYFILKFKFFIKLFDNRQ